MHHDRQHRIAEGAEDLGAQPEKVGAARHEHTRHRNRPRNTPHFDSLGSGYEFGSMVAGIELVNDENADY